VTLGYATEMDSPLARSVNKGYGPMHHPAPNPGAHNIDLDDPTLEPSTPVFGRDEAIVASGMKVVRSK
jgi:hypothetical protein